MRARDPQNRRKSRVELTAAGKAAHGRLLQAVIAFNQRLGTGLSEEELAQLSASLTRLRANVSPRPLAAAAEPRARP